jgi:hypothetical protein
VTTRTVRLTVDVRIDDDEISGHASDGGDQPRSFHGWLSLITALNDLLDVPSTAPRHERELRARSGGTADGSGGR